MKRKLKSQVSQANKYKLLICLLAFFPLVANAQQRTVTGTITDAATNEPLPGVNIVIKGTTQGTITNIDGKYSIAINSEEETLVITSLGFLSEEVPVNGKSIIDMHLVADIKSLDEVVVVGYGVQNKATLTGSIETVSGKSLKDKVSTNPVLSLQGQTPGLVVTRTSSRPGNEELKMQIRGETSVNGGDPLIIIDGSPVINNEAFYNLNADDIESISVLKDASASIYGSRAANGVILVTTKRGVGETKVEIGSILKINTIGIRPPTPTMQEYATVWLEAAEQDADYGGAEYWGWANEDNLLRMQSGEEGIYSTRYWGDIFIGNYPRFDEMYGTSVSNQQNLSVSGSAEKSAYRLSAQYAENIGALKTAYDGQRQYNIRFNHDYQVYKWLKLETGVAYFSTHTSSPSGGLGYTSISYDPPFFPSKNPYGQWYANFNIAGNRNSVAETVDGGRENTRRDQVNLNFATTIDITKDLNIKATAAINKDFYSYQKYELTIPTYTWYGELADESINPESSIKEENKNIFYQNYGAFANYSKYLGNHSISAMVGVTAEKSKDKKLTGYRKGFEDVGVYDIELGSEDEKVEASGGSGQWGLYSYVGRFNYGYKNKYLLEVSGRRDGSSKFHSDYRWSNFGGGSIGWVLSEEAFMSNIEMLSFLKLRASYGEMGNQSGIKNFDYLSLMGFGTAIFGVTPAQQTTAWLSSMVSYDRTWERVKNTTLGFDFKLFNSQLYGSFDYYMKKNNGMLMEIAYPGVIGATAPKTNNGELDTKGWEVVVGWRSEINDFKYNISVNVGDSRNELTKLEGNDAWDAGLVEAREGYPINSYFMYETDGFFANEEEVTQYYEDYTSSVSGGVPSGSDVSQRLRPGDTKRVDRDGNGYISAVGDGVDDKGDVKFMGDNAPHYNFGVNLSAQWKNFDMSAFFQGTLHQYVQRTGYMRYPFSTLYTNQITSYIGKTWTEENTGAEYPRMTANTTRARWNWMDNDFMLQDNRYIRLKSLVVGYTFNELKISRLNIDKLRLYFSGNDLFEFTSLKDGFDPEFGESSNSSYPFTRTWAFGATLTF